MLDTDGTRWLSYTELAAALGVKRESAIRLVRRKPWPKRRGNGSEGVRVGVPADVLADRSASCPSPDVLPDVFSDITLTTLQATLALLGTQLEHERDRANRAERRVEQAEAVAVERETWLRRQIEAITAVPARPLGWRGAMAWFRSRG